MFTEEIEEQPQALRNCVQYYRSEEGRSLLARCPQLPGAEDSITFTGMGSSLYASYAVLPSFWQARYRAAPYEAGEILHYGLPRWRSQGPLVAVSQSGESAETLALAQQAEGVAPIIAVTNEPESRLAKLAQITLLMHAGVESAISTKTYTNTLAVLHLLTSAVLGEPMEKTLHALESVADAMQESRRDDLEEAVQGAARILDDSPSVHFIGRGPSLAATYVGALVIGEGARLTAVGLPAASFRHGPMELAGNGNAAVLMMPDSPTRPLMEKLRNDLDRVGTRTITLTDRASEALAFGAVELVLAETPGESFFPFVAAIGVERLLAAVAHRRGITPGDFRYGGKVTAEE